MQLQDFFDYKNKLMEDLLTSQEVVSLLNEKILMQNADELAYKQVFPYEYIPETVQEGKTFICFDVDILESYNKTFLLPVLYIWVFTHKSLLRLPEGGVRTDKLCSEICKLINGSKKYSLGELNLYSTKRFAIATDMQGKVMSFRGKEINRLYDGTKEVPKNRKRG